GEPQLCLTGMAQTAAPTLSMDGQPVSSFAGVGTFAEEIILPESAAIVIDDDVPWEIASLIGCAVTTGVGAAINTAKVRPGSSVAVIGCGGVGISVIQGARIAGAAEIVAIDLSPERREAAKRFGATHATDPDGLEALKN